MLGDMSSAEENSTNHTEGEEEQGKETKVEGKASNMPDVSGFFTPFYIVFSA